jgi:hypothetical protein
MKRSPISIDSYAQSNPGVLLKRADNPEEILSVRVSLRGEHPVQALARLLDFSRKHFEVESQPSWQRNPK